MITAEPLFVSPPPGGDVSLACGPDASQEYSGDASPRGPGDTSRCAWPACSAPLTPGQIRRGGIYHNKACRQAAWRLREQLGTAALADEPKRLAYADPPYPGLSDRYYGDHPDFAGEVDHAALLSRLRGYDGWALSTSAAALPEILALCVAQGLRIRVASWVRGSRHTPARRPLSTWEPVVYAGARPVVSPHPGQDALVYAARARRMGPHIIGAKPWTFLSWLFRDLLQARAGDEFHDLFPGSGGVRLAWNVWASPTAPCDVSRAAPADVSRSAASDTP